MARTWKPLGAILTQSGTLKTAKIASPAMEGPDGQRRRYSLDVGESVARHLTSPVQGFVAACKDAGSLPQVKVTESQSVGTEKDKASVSAKATGLVALADVEAYLGVNMGGATSPENGDSTHGNPVHGDALPPAIGDRVNGSIPEPSGNGHGH